MEFYCISISHQHTALNIREQLSCAQPELSLALAHYGTHSDQYLGPASEIAVLSTCNRFEIYLTFRSEDHPFAGQVDTVRRRLLDFIANITGYTGADLPALGVFYQNLGAVEHLFRVTAGLESQVLGEVQIIGQVSDALDAALQAGSARHTLASLFRAALHTAKRAHTETAIGRNPASLSSVAASIAEQTLGAIHEQPVVVVGAGEMSALAVRAFHARGARRITIINRTYEHAVRLANQYGCQAGRWEELADAVKIAAVVVTATGARQPILTAEAVQMALAQREQRPLLLLDIALPRNIDPAARDLPGVTLFDLDDIKLRLNQSLEQRQKEAEQVETILQEELNAFAHWMKVIPTVGKLHRKAEKIRQHEVQRMLHHLPDLDPEVQAQVELLTRSLVKKLFHEPSIKMRHETQNGELNLYRDTLQFLFGLDDDDHHPSQPYET